jgi:hypothetical protein
MTYPKLKQIITLKKAQLAYAAKESRHHRLNAIIYGTRHDQINLYVRKLGGEDMVEIFKLRSCSRTTSLGYDLFDEVYDTPSRAELLSMSNALNDEFKVVTADMMYDIFLDWGETRLDKWAIECNNSYKFVFELYYDHASLMTIQSINVYGKPNIDLPTYIYNYAEAQTMYKLETNL